MRLLRILFVAAALGCASAYSAPSLPETGIYVGTTPCDAVMREFLAIPRRAQCDRIRWDLWLTMSPKQGSLAATVSVEYGEGDAFEKVTDKGAWTLERGMPEHPDAVIITLSIGKRMTRLWRVGPHTLHFIDKDDRQLLVGNARFGYALSTATQSKLEAGVTVPAFDASPIVTGAIVFGVYEGRTPCGIAQVFGRPQPERCAALDWRVTFFQAEGSCSPYRYRLEGSLFPEGPREGAMQRLVSTSFNADATVYKLDAAEGAQPAYLMRGDDNVLLFIDRTGSLGIGDREHNYALGRRSDSVGCRAGSHSDDPRA